MATVTEIRDLARILGLWNIAKGNIDITDETVSNIDYICNIFLAEIEMRKAKKKETLWKESYLPDKTFDKSKITQGLKWQLQKIEQFNFKEDMQNFVIVGDCVTGKTSLATEIGGYAIDKGASVQYVTIEDLFFAIKNRTARWNRILKADMIIIDDVFYIAPTEEELVTFYRTIVFLSETDLQSLCTEHLLLYQLHILQSQLQVMSFRFRNLRQLQSLESAL